MRCPVCGGYAKKVGEDKYGIIYRCSVCGNEWTTTPRGGFSGKAVGAKLEKYKREQTAIKEIIEDVAFRLQRLAPKVLTMADLPYAKLALERQIRRLEEAKKNMEEIEKEFFRKTLSK